MVCTSWFRLLALLSVPAYLLAMYWDFSARFFQLAPLGWAEWLQVAAVALPACGLSLLSDHYPSRKRQRQACGNRR